MNISVLTLSLSSQSGDELREEDIGQDFDIVMEALLYDEQRETDSLYFTFTVASPNMVGKRQVDSFLQPTLLLEEFSISTVRRHIDRLLMQVKSCKSWECVAFRLSPFMVPASPYAWQL